MPRRTLLHRAHRSAALATGMIAMYEHHVSFCYAVIGRAYRGGRVLRLFLQGIHRFRKLRLLLLTQMLMILAEYYESQISWRVTNAILLNDLS